MREEMETVTCATEQTGSSSALSQLYITLHVLLFLLTARTFYILFPLFVHPPASHVKTLAQTLPGMYVECAGYKRMGNMWRVQGH